MSAPDSIRFVPHFWAALGGDAGALDRLAFRQDGPLPSAFDVSGLASAAIGVAGLALAELAGSESVTLDRRLASLWFRWSMRPLGWTLPPVWDAIAGDYPTADGWIRLHTNAAHHRAAALAVLGPVADRAAAAKVVATWTGQALEDAVVAAEGCAAVMRTLSAWAEHPQGRAVAAAPVVAMERRGRGNAPEFGRPGRPLAGVKVLDLTRVLAGPVATRFLAGYGATVLRLDPPEWDEPAVLPDVTLGKRRARLDLRTPAGAAHFQRLLAEADVLVHGYRADALARLGWPDERLHAARPGLIDVALNAYGWSGPWAMRRGFDSLVQMSTGIAAAGMAAYGTAQPKPLPVQALDHAAGYLMAAAALRGLVIRQATGQGSVWRTSLAGVAASLCTTAGAATAEDITAGDDDYAATPESMEWGAAQRLRPPVLVAGAPMSWDIPAGTLGTVPPDWG